MAEVGGDVPSMPAKGSGRVLAVLLLAFIFNFIDRQILGILVIPIKADLQLTDTQLGLVGGVAFALFFSTVGIPVAWLADRTSRVNIIAGAVALWSAFTAISGFAQNFWHLFLARMGVAIGEAGGSAPSYALISDYFPRQQRARAVAIFSTGSSIGAALGIFFGGWIAANLDWRWAFIIVGVAGLPVALAVKLMIAEPRRGAFDGVGAAAGQSAPAFSRAVKMLVEKPSFWLLSVGAGTASIVGYGWLFWLPSMLNRSFGLSLSQVSWYYGSIILVGGIAGNLLGGWLCDRLAMRNRAAYAVVPALSFIGAAPLFALGLFAPSLGVAWILFTLAQTLSIVWLGPVVIAVQHVVAPTVRATASASLFFLNNSIGIGVGILFLGWISDAMTAEWGKEALRYSMLYGLGFYLLGGVLLLGAGSRLKRDWHQD